LICRNWIGFDEEEGKGEEGAIVFCIGIWKRRKAKRACCATGGKKGWEKRKEISKAQRADKKRKKIKRGCVWYQKQGKKKSGWSRSAEELLLFIGGGEEEGFHYPMCRKRGESRRFGGRQPCLRREGRRGGKESSSVLQPNIKIGRPKGK